MKARYNRLVSLSVAVVVVMTMITGCGKGEKSGDVSNSNVPAVVKEVEELGTGDVKWQETETPDGYVLVTNEGGKTLGYSKESGVKLIQVDGFAFKDLNQNDKLDQYEDWRNDVETRAINLANQLEKEDIAGLMLYSGHQFNVSGELSDDQKAFLDEGLRAVLNAASASSIEKQAEFNNAMQSYVEGKRFGIPVNSSTDPRNTNVSYWPSNLGLAATFDPEVAKEAGKVQSTEYRSFGLGTLLGPQIDIASEPRWFRISGTFGEDPALSRDMTNMFASGIQSTYDEAGNDLGWGENSMNAMIKHWPGDGAAEGGRESHAEVGKYAVYPGGQFDTHLIPFVDGGFNLESSTQTAAAIMSSYSVAFSSSDAYGELVGSAYSDYKIKDLLRGQYGYEGVVCTDWGITEDGGRTYGAYDLSEAQRHYKIIMAGVDQFGGNNDPAPIIEAYEIGVSEIGEEAIKARFAESAKRLLKNYFAIGLFDNAYVDVTNATMVAESDEFVKAGYDAMLKSVVMLKNDDAIKSSEGEEKPTVYIPMVYTAASKPDFGAPIPASWGLPVDMDEASEFFNIITDKVSETLTGPANEEGNPTVAVDDIIRASKEELAGCTLAIAVVKAPTNPGSMMGGYGYNKETGEYIPLTLQYNEYTADSDAVLKTSAAGDITEVELDSGYGAQTVEEKENRSYYGKSTIATNTAHLDSILYAANNVPEGTKVIAAISATTPFIVEEFEEQVDGIIVGFDIQTRALLEVAAGKVEPSGLLPVNMPRNMEAVEEQLEDVPRDTESYVDAAGNTYKFAFGLDWSGVIKDSRTEKYDVDALVYPTNTGN